MHPDRHHQIDALRSGLEPGQIAAADLDRHTAAARQRFGLGQPHGAEILGEHAMAQLGQMHRIAACSRRKSLGCSP